MTEYEDKYGAEHLPKMKSMFERGYSTRAIAKEVGVSAMTVRRRLLEAGVDLGGPGRKLLIGADYVELTKRMRADGIEWIAVSEKIGFSIRQLQRHLQLTR